MSLDLDTSSLYSIKGLAILDQDGNRVLAKYYDQELFPTQKEQRAFEKSLFQKTNKANAEIIMLDGLICVYRSNVDLFFYVMGSSNENELILVSALNCLYDSVSLVLRKNVEKKALVDNMDIAMLILDEICDNGVLLETEPQAVISRCALRQDELTFGDQSISQVGMSQCESSLIDSMSMASPVKHEVLRRKVATPTKTPTRMPRSPIKNVKSETTPSKAKRKVKFDTNDDNESSLSKSPRKQKIKNGDMITNNENMSSNLLHKDESNEDLLVDFENELTKVPTQSVIDNYFNLGKMRKPGKRSRRKKGCSPEWEEKSEGDKNPEEIECDLEKLRDWLQVADEYIPKEVKQRNKATKELFPTWLNYLSVGFNLLLYGTGSKRAIMQGFCDEALSEYTHLIVDAFYPAVSTRIILQCLETKLNVKNRGKCGNTLDWASNIASIIGKRNEDIILVINNIDGVGMRDNNQQWALVELAKCPRIHIVASFDHLNTFLLWTQEEILAGDSKLLGLNMKTSGRAHTQASLDVVWASLTFNSRMVLYKVARVFYSTNEPLEFFNLYRQAREDFLVSSETALRQQLVELDDHHLITKKRHQDGDEYIAMNVDPKVMRTFLESKGLVMDEVED